MVSRRHDAARVFEVLPYPDTATGRQFLVHQDGSVIRGRHTGGNLAEQASWALASASGYALGSAAGGRISSASATAPPTRCCISSRPTSPACSRTRPTRPPWCGPATRS
ncbi:hypothetical protein ACFQ0B_81900 [Nonomuraea thailandensis]